MNKAVAVKTNSFWVLLHILCFVTALMNLITFEFGDVGSLLKSAETGLNVFFQLGKLLSVRAIAKLNFCSTWIVIF